MCAGSSDVETYMLVDQDDPNVLSFLCKSRKCILYLRSLGFMVNDKEVSLCIGWFCDMTDACKQ